MVKEDNFILLNKRKLLFRRRSRQEQELKKKKSFAYSLTIALPCFKGLNITFTFIEIYPVYSRKWVTNKYWMNVCEKERVSQEVNLRGMNDEGSQERRGDRTGNKLRTS